MSKNLPLYEVTPITDIRDMIEKSVSRYGARPAFWRKKSAKQPYEPVTYTQFGQDIRALALWLQAGGLGGRRVAVIGENRYEWAVSYLSVLCGVGVVVPIDKDLPAREIENLLNISEAEAIIFSGKYSAMVSGFHAPSVRVRVCMDDRDLETGHTAWSTAVDEGRRLMDAGNRGWEERVIDPEALAVLLFTSGTTGAAKGVMHNHRSLSANLSAMSSMLFIGQEDVFLSVLPLHHTYECTCGFLCPVYRGASVAYCEGLRHVAKNLQEAGVTVMLGVPLLFESMYKKIWEGAAAQGKAGILRKLLAVNRLTSRVGVDLSGPLFKSVRQNLGGKLRIMISGAAGIDPAVAAGFRAFGMGFVQGYGLTECAPIVALNRDVDFRDDAAGLPLPGVTVKIHAPGPDGVGEIICKGPNVMSGYFHMPEETAAVLIDGWFHTGDLGLVDADGFVKITGRKKNVIITKNGKNVYPEEIETLLGRLPMVAEVLVLADAPGPDGDLMLCAHVYPDKEACEARGLTEARTIHDAIWKEITSVNREMPIYKKISRLHLRDVEFEKTTSRKIKRHGGGHI